MLTKRCLESYNQC